MSEELHNSVPSVNSAGPGGFPSQHDSIANSVFCEQGVVSFDDIE